MQVFMKAGRTPEGDDRGSTKAHRTHACMCTHTYKIRILKLNCKNLLGCSGRFHLILMPRCQCSWPWMLLPAEVPKIQK